MINEKMERQYRRELLFVSEPSKTSLSRSDIERLLPHRESMLLIDAITGIDIKKKQITGKRLIKESDPGFVGHFPSYPVYPGVLQIEMMGQLGVCLAMFLSYGSSTIPNDAEPLSIRLWKVHKAVFVSELKPKDEVTILASVLEDTGASMTCVGQLVRGCEIVSFSVVEALIA